MGKDIIWFAENIWGVKLTETQKEILCAVQNSKDKGEKVFLSYGRMQGIGLLKNILYGFEIWLKDQRIAELEEQLKNAIVLKFKLGDYFIEYWNKEPSIYQYQGDLHFKCLNKSQGYHCDYVILGALLLEKDFIKQITKEEAQAKLKELGE